jgi:hypothetical protein
MQRRQFIRGSLSVATAAAAAGVIPSKLAFASAPIAISPNHITSPLTLLQQLHSELRKSRMSHNSPSVFAESYTLTHEVLQRLQAARPVAPSLWQNLADSIARTRQHDPSVDADQQLQQLVAHQIELLSRSSQSL